MAEASAPETYGFQAEVKQLLHLMVHSLYSDREIFLRELISNASDACDKLRFEALKSPEMLADAGSLEIEITLDKDGRRVTVADNGIGMSREEVIEQLGTIAHSGTSRFLEKLTGDQKKDSQLIGQFGVGFYSSFIVAKEVTVVTRRADQAPEAASEWSSTGEGEFTIRAVEKPGPGTEVTLALKDDADEFLEEYRIRGLIRKYSDHVGFPIKLKILGQEPKAAEQVNRAKALWLRPRTEIEDAEYIEFYRHITHDLADPLSWSHNKVEGKREYTSLLYLPAVAPMDLWNREAPRGVKLYVQRVFITDRAAEFLPLYLRFVRGVVDCADLSLNVSREMLQHDPAIDAMRAALTKRALDMIARLADSDAAKYATFWSQFGATLKEGLAEDAANRDKIASLLRFCSTRAVAEESRSLDDYLASLKPGQDQIYYLIADSPAAVAASPHLEAFRAHDIEVLLLSDRIDEWALQYLTEYQGKPLRDISRGELELPEAAAEIVAEPDKEQKDLLKRIKRALRDRVEEVRISQRLRESAACIVLGDADLGYQMQEMLKAAGQQLPESKPNLEVNLEHALLKRLAAEPDPDRFGRLAELVFDQAVLAEGRQLKDPARFVRTLNEVWFAEERAQ